MQPVTGTFISCRLTDYHITTLLMMLLFKLFPQTVGKGRGIDGRVVPPNWGVWICQCMGWETNTVHTSTAGEMTGKCSGDKDQTDPIH